MMARYLVALLIIGSLTACSSTDRVLFMTSTSIGINADATAGTVDIGYDRIEGMVGPAYVDTGDVPRVVGVLQSNLQIFEPKIKQLYATGDAATLATDSTLKKPSGPSTATGQRRVMFFGTTSNIGLKLGFAGELPDSINFGYKRKEMSIIPLQPKDPVPGKVDIYPSVLASIDMDQTTGSIRGTGLAVSQFFATGVAADNLAQTDRVRETFKFVAGEAVQQGAAVAERIMTSAEAFASCISPNPGPLDPAATGRLNTFVGHAVADIKLPAGKAAALRGATTRQEVVDLLTGGLLSDAPALRSVVAAHRSDCA